MRIGRYLMAAALAVIMVLIMAYAPDNDRTLEEVGTDVVSVMTSKVVEEKGQGELKRYYGISRDDVEGFLLYGPSSAAEVEELLIVKVKDRDQMRELRNAAEERRLSQVETFAAAGGTQEELLADYRIRIRGDFFFYCVSSEADALTEAFCKSVRE